MACYLHTCSQFFVYIFQLHFKRYEFEILYLEKSPVIVYNAGVMILFEGYRTFSINYVYLVIQITCMYILFNKSQLSYLAMKSVRLQCTYM